LAVTLTGSLKSEQNALSEKKIEPCGRTTMRKKIETKERKIKKRSDYR
jgi:hypothetical protein